MKPIFIILFLLLLSSNLSLPLKAACTHTRIFHMFIVTDNQDVNIRSIIKSDQDVIENTFKQMAEESGFRFQTHQFSGHRFHADSITVHLQSLQNKLEDKRMDVVCFYYSGHGHLNKFKCATAFSSSLDLNNKTQLCTETVKNLIHQLNPKLSILIFDCCSNHRIIPNKTIEKSVIPIRTPYLEGVKSNYQHLLTDYNGLLAIYSCDAAQQALAIESYGSLFTKQLCKAIQDQSRQSICTSWESILNITQEKTKIMAKDHYQHYQTPIIDSIYLKCNK